MENRALREADLTWREKYMHLLNRMCSSQLGGATPRGGGVNYMGRKTGVISVSKITSRIRNQSGCAVYGRGCFYFGSKNGGLWVYLVGPIKRLEGAEPE